VLTKEGHGPQSLVQAFAHSCDVFFYQTGLAAGADALYAKALEFGFSKKTGIDLPGKKKALCRRAIGKKEMEAGVV